MNASRSQFSMEGKPTSFAPVWRPTNVCWKDEARNVYMDADHLIRTVLGFALAFIAACCYMKLIPSASIVVATALSARIASLIIGDAQR
jgi:hypothetical protein